MHTCLGMTEYKPFCKRELGTVRWAGGGGGHYTPPPYIYQAATRLSSRRQQAARMYVAGTRTFLPGIPIPAQSQAARSPDRTLLDGPTAFWGPRLTLSVPKPNPFDRLGQPNGFLWVPCSLF